MLFFLFFKKFKKFNLKILFNCIDLGNLIFRDQDEQKL